MTTGKAYGVLFGTFLLSLFVSLVILAFSYFNREIYDDTFKRLALKLLEYYSVHLSLISAGVFAKHSPSTLARAVPPLPAYSAIGAMAIWNLLVLGRFCMFLFAVDDDSQALEGYLTTVVPATAFLVSGALAYFFIKS